MTSTNIQLTRRDDVPALTKVLQRTRLFPADLLGEMLEPGLSGEAQDIWLTSHDQAGPVGFCYAAPEEMADRVWNLLAIGVLPEQQGQGVGTALINAIEQRLRDQRQRLLLVDTSATVSFAHARSLYLRLGFEQEARIRDYWADGDDKITFRKFLRK